MPLDFGQHQEGKVEGWQVAGPRHTLNFLFRQFHSQATVPPEQVGCRAENLGGIDRHQSAFFSAAAVLNLIEVEAAISMASPVFGLRP